MNPTLEAALQRLPPFFKTHGQDVFLGLGALSLVAMATTSNAAFLLLSPTVYLALGFASWCIVQSVALTPARWHALWLKAFHARYPLLGALRPSGHDLDELLNAWQIQSKTLSSEKDLLVQLDRRCLEFRLPDILDPVLIESLRPEGLPQAHWAEAAGLAVEDAISVEASPCWTFNRFYTYLEETVHMAKQEENYRLHQLYLDLSPEEHAKLMLPKVA